MIGICLAWVLLGAQDAQKPPVVAPVPVQSPVPVGVQPGDRVTIHFLATLKDGRELADSERRALPLTFVVGGPPLVRGLDAVVRGMAVGETKTVELPETEAFGAEGVPPIVPAHATLVLRVRLLKVVKAPPAAKPPIPPPVPTAMISKRYQNDIIGCVETLAGRLPGC